MGDTKPCGDMQKYREVTGRSVAKNWNSQNLFDKNRNRPSWPQLGGKKRGENNADALSSPLLPHPHPLTTGVAH